MRIEKKSKFDEPLKVLVVEDNEVDSHMLQAMLHEPSHAATSLKTARTFSQAKSLLEKHEFDVVLLDLNLPDRNGPDTLKNLREKFPEIPIVVNTGAYEDDLGIRTLGLGAQDFLIKGKYNTYVINKVLHYAIERKRLEQELKEAYERLKTTQAQLIQSEKMKVVGALASGVAHEVKNPLATILYGVTYLCEQLQGKGQNVDRVLDNIKEAISKASNIVTDLLNFSRLTTFTKKKEDLNKVAEKTLALLSYYLEKKGIKVTIDLDKKIPKIKIDANRIEQVLINLVLNAAHAIRSNGKIKLKTSYKRLSKTLKELPGVHKNGFHSGQQVVILTLEDSGCGIPEEKKDLIFDPFFTTRRADGGVGLGLTVSQNIMETHQGLIAVENRKQGGARAILVFKV